MDKFNNIFNNKLELKIKDYHWWFIGRKKLLKRILNSINFLNQNIIIEVGCGAGQNLSLFNSKKYFVIGFDISFYALSLIKKTKISLINGDLNNLPFKNNSIGLIIAMDVIEHLQNDITGIREINRVLITKGILILTVPAFKSLWGLQDIITGHKKRYSLKEIKTILKNNNFYLIKFFYFNFFLFFPILLIRKLILFLNLRIKSENEINFPLLNFFLKIIFTVEILLSKYIKFPFGVSILCIAKKK